MNPTLTHDRRHLSPIPHQRSRVSGGSHAFCGGSHAFCGGSHAFCGGSHASFIRRAALVLAALWCPGALWTFGALAQSGQLGGQSERTFDLRDLSSRKGIITISPHFQVVLVFPEDVDEIGANHPEIMAISPKDPAAMKNRLYLDAARTNGSSDLNVTIKSGLTLMFRVSVDAKAYSGISKYTVRAPEQAPSDTVQPSEANADSASRTPSGTVSSAASSAPVTNPEWLNLTLSPTLNANGEVTVAYALTNKGANPVVADTGKLTLRSIGDDRALGFKVARQSSSASSLVIQPARAQYGTILLTDPDLKAVSLHLTWALTDARTRARYVFERDLSVPAATSRSRPRQATASAIKPATPKPAPKTPAVVTTANTVPPASAAPASSLVFSDGASPNRAALSNPAWALVNVTRTVSALDARLDRPDWLGMFFNTRRLERAGVEFEITLENRGSGGVQAAPGDLCLFVASGSGAVPLAFAVPGGADAPVIRLGSEQSFTHRIRLESLPADESLTVTLEWSIRDARGETTHVFQRSISIERSISDVR